MTDQPRLVRISLLTALAPAVWGSTYLVTTEFLPPDRPLLASTLRALPAGLILLLITRVLPRGIWWIRATVLGVLNIGAFFYCLFLAAYHLPGGVAALVTAVQPLIVLLLGPLVLGARIRPRHLGAFALAALGVALLVLQPKRRTGRHRRGGGAPGGPEHGGRHRADQALGAARRGLAAGLHRVAAHRRRAGPAARHPDR